MIFRVVWVILATLILGLHPRTQAGEYEELVSLIAAVLDNASSWRSYDALIKHEMFVQGPLNEVGPDGGLGDPRTMNTLIRFAVDWDEKKFFVFMKRDAQWDDPKKKDSKELLPPKSMGRYMMFQAGKAKGRFFPGRTEDFQRGLTMEHLLHASEAPDLRLAGLRTSLLPFDESSGFDRHIRERGIKESGHGLKINVERANDQINVSTLTQDGTASFGYVYDIKSLMTERLSCMTRSSRDEPFCPISTTEFSWKEMDGIYVPTSITADSRNNTRAGWRTWFENFSIHWLSLNEPLNKDLFDESLEKDLGALMKCVDVESLGADELK